MKKDAKENGITLVALVVTIIVLLILAGVSLSLVLGDNGIITRAQDAVTKYKEAEAEEQWQMVALNQEGQNLAWALQEQGYSVSELGEGYLVADVEQKNLYYCNEKGDILSKEVLNVSEDMFNFEAKSGTITGLSNESRLLL